jgi:glycosyltransferase involved in cell wall biosynthesis
MAYFIIFAKKMPVFSIVIPLYNKENYIENTLKSVFNQTFKDFEVLIINDGSTDQSCKIAASFTDSRVRLLHQTNQGASAARNLGIQNAKAANIVFLDADDYWYPNHLETLYLLEKEFSNCAIYCSRYLTKIAKNKVIETDFSYSFPTDFRGVIPDYFESCYVNRVATSSSIFVKKAILEENNCFNTAISSGQDLELWTKIAINHKVAISDKITAIYHFEAQNSLSKTPINKKTLMDFDQFEIAEKSNPSLKKFLDIYRLEYALQFKIIGNTTKSNFYLKDITSKIPFKTKLLLFMPSFMLQKLLKTKHLLKKYGIDFTVYH